MIRAKFSPKAARDLDEISGYISADNPGAADRVRRIILNTADLLAQHPELGRRVRKAAARHLQIRWFVVPKFRNYLIFYQPFQETIVVVRVLHAA
jgi:plasmid stabilization system protein ParE